MNQTKRVDWKSVATEAAKASISERLRNVTSVWAAARHEYLTLWDAENPDVPSLRNAVRRLEGIDRMRRALANQLESAA